ncbi:hypothetical protein TWF696_003794 [Orbilia brochopaga]|uniref:Uncharacterized protein n=1 Tax=Orbilia brochopaga TaxID=3140254 RepID=A0AAV9V787_9PEZI
MMAGSLWKKRLLRTMSAIKLHMESSTLMELERGGQQVILEDPDEVELEDTNLDDFTNGQQQRSNLFEEPGQNAFASGPEQQDDGEGVDWVERTLTYLSNKEPDSFTEQQYTMPRSDDNPFPPTRFADFGQNPSANLETLQNIEEETSKPAITLNEPPSFMPEASSEEVTTSWEPYPWSIPQQVAEDILDPSWNPSAGGQKKGVEEEYQFDEAVQFRQPKQYARQRYTAIKRCPRLRGDNPRLTWDEAASYNRFLDIYGYPVINPPDSLGPYLADSLSDPELNFYQSFLDRFQIGEKEVVGEDGVSTGVTEPVLFEPARKNYGCNAILYKEKRFCELRAS